VLKTGIIGLGKVGKKRAEIIRGQKEYELIATCDTEPSAEADYANYKHMLEDEKDINCVFVCVPHTLTKDIVIDCLDRGLNVFAEKPPGCSLSDTIQLKEAIERNPKCKLLFGFNHRYHQHIQKALQIIKSGALGKIMWMRGHYGKVQLEKWRQTKELAGRGILLSQGIHMVDLFRYLADTEFEEVHAFTSHFWKKWFEDNVFMIMRSNKGIVGSIHSSCVLGMNRFEIFLGMTKGYVHIDNIITSTRSFGFPEKTSVAALKNTKFYGNPKVEVNFFGIDPSWEIEIINFADIVLKDKKKYPCSIDDAIEVMKILDKVYEDEKIPV